MLIYHQGCTHGGVCTDDAAKPPLCSFHEEAGQIGIYTTKPGDHQGSQAGEAKRTGTLEWRDHFADPPDAASLVVSLPQTRNAD